MGLVGTGRYDIQTQMKLWRIICLVILSGVTFVLFQTLYRISVDSAVFNRNSWRYFVAVSSAVIKDVPFMGDHDAPKYIYKKSDGSSATLNGVFYKTKHLSESEVLATLSQRICASHQWTISATEANRAVLVSINRPGEKVVVETERQQSGDLLVRVLHFVFPAQQHRD